MTEAVILALIALGGLMLFSTTTIILVAVIMKTNPNHIHFWTEYGCLTVDYNTKIDK